MNRRGFLGLLGAALIAPVVVKELLSEQLQSQLPAPRKSDPNAATLEWWGKLNVTDGEWHKFTVTRSNGIETRYMDGKVLSSEKCSASGFPKMITEDVKPGTLVHDLTLTYGMPKNPMQWPAAVT